MPASLDLGSVLSPHTFSLFVAPPETIQEALSTLMSRHRGKVLYLCGNYPGILPGFTAYTDKMLVRRALTVYQVQSILEEATEPLILFEHDRSLYDDNADILPYIGELCRYKAKDAGSVFLVSTRLDKWLIRLEPYVERMILIMGTEKPPGPAPAAGTSVQKVLEGLW
jgi:hypothetical protein